MTAYVDTAAIVEQVLADAGRMTQVPPDRTANGYEWACNACPYRSHSTDQAFDHAVEMEERAHLASHPFAHILYEVPRGQEGRAGARRRIHPARHQNGVVYGMVMAPPKTAASAAPKAADPAPTRRPAAKKKASGRSRKRNDGGGSASLL